VVVNQSIIERPPLQNNELSTWPSQFRPTLRQSPKLGDPSVASLFVATLSLCNNAVQSRSLESNAMTEIQAEAGKPQPSDLKGFWDAFKAVRSLRSQAYRWAEVVDPGTTLQLSVFLDEAERSLDPILDVLERIICRESGHALSSVGPVPPILDAVELHRKLLLGQAMHWLQSRIDLHETYRAPRCDDADRFSDIIITWYRGRHLKLQLRYKSLGTIQPVDIPDGTLEQFLRVLDSLLDELTSSAVGYDDNYLYWIMGIDAPDAASSMLELLEAAARAKVIQSEASRLSEDSLRRYAYLTGKLDEIRVICRTVWGFQDTVIAKARQELASIEQHLSRLQIVWADPREQTPATDELPLEVQSSRLSRDQTEATSQPGS